MPRLPIWEQGGKAGTNAYQQEENNMDLMQSFNEKYLKAEPPKVEVGDTVRVHIFPDRRLNGTFPPQTH